MCSNITQVSYAGVAELVMKRPLPVAEQGSEMLSEITSISEHFSAKLRRLFFRPDDAPDLGCATLEEQWIY